MPERIALARPLLLHAEAAAPAADSATRAFLLYRAAGAWLDLDRTHAIELDRQAFAAARLISSIPLRKAAEHDILSDLLPLSPSALLDLVPQSESETQNLLYRAAINFALTQSNLPRAIQAFDQAAAAGVFSEPAATHVLTAIPESNTAERVRVFNSAFAAYKAQTPDHSKTWTASRLVARYWQSLPAVPVLSGIDILLARAVEKDKQQPLGSGSVGSGNNSLSYKTYTDLELFAVAPALKKLDPARAAALLAAHPVVEEYLHRFPGGLPSFDPVGFYPGGSGIGVSTSLFLPLGTASYATEKGAHSMALSPLDMGLEFTIPLDLNVGLGVTGSIISYAPGSPEAALVGTGITCPPDVPHILASVATVPLTRRVPTTCSGLNGAWCNYREESPRADLVNNIAERCTYYRDKSAALSALTAQLQFVSQLPVDQRPEFLANAADLYLRLRDRDAAASTVKIGFEVAATLFAQDNESSALKSIPKAVWSSAEVYRRMVSLGVNANFDQTRATVEAIPDPDLRELEQVMLARALLGIPVRRRIVFYAGGSSMTGNPEPGYDDF